jgi:hypothetical protein
MRMPNGWLYDKRRGVGGRLRSKEDRKCQWSSGFGVMARHEDFDQFKK